MSLGRFLTGMLADGAGRMANTARKYSRDPRLSDEDREKLSYVANNWRSLHDSIEDEIE